MSKETISKNNIQSDKDPFVYVIHENEEWLIPLREAFQELNIPFKEWFINNGSVSLNDVPPTECSIIG